jgi:hypothetical protein
MSDDSSWRPYMPVKLHAPEVDFIENRLAEYHGAFNTRTVRYDNTLHHFVALTPLQTIPAPGNLAAYSVPPPLQPRPTPGSVNDMSFWSEVFPKAMNLLKREPETAGRDKSKWGIRQLSLWRDVQARLDLAKRHYEFNDQPGYIGKARKKTRQILDKTVAPVQQGMKLAPNTTVASPVVGVINTILDVRNRSMKLSQ